MAIKRVEAEAVIDDNEVAEAARFVKSRPLDDAVGSCIHRGADFGAQIDAGVKSALVGDRVLPITEAAGFAFVFQRIAAGNTLQQEHLFDGCLAGRVEACLDIATSIRFEANHDFDGAKLIADDGQLGFFCCNRLLQSLMFIEQEGEFALR